MTGSFCWLFLSALKRVVRTSLLLEMHKKTPPERQHKTQQKCNFGENFQFCNFTILSLPIFFTHNLIPKKTWTPQKPWQLHTSITDKMSSKNHSPVKVNMRKQQESCTMCLSLMICLVSFYLAGNVWGRFQRSWQDKWSRKEWEGLFLYCQSTQYHHHITIRLSTTHIE